MPILKQLINTVYTKLFWLKYKDRCLLNKHK